VSIDFQKKMNARMKDALEETLMLSDRFIRRSPVKGTDLVLSFTPLFVF
jgi:hypothetical protein